MKHRRVFMQSDFIVVGSFFSPGLIATDYTLPVDLIGTQHVLQLACMSPNHADRVDAVC